jgi:hypothetical protein
MATATNPKPAVRVAAKKPAAKPTGQEMTNLLGRFGVDYKNAPAPTPAMLAFMRGLGMTLDTLTDAKQKQVMRIKDRSTTALGDIDTANERTKTNMLADLVRRGVLRSGESNTRYGQQAENVARQKSGVLRDEAEGIDSADTIYNSGRDQLRQQALERTLDTETNEATRKASLAAQEQSWKRQDAAAELAYRRQREAEERSIQNQIKLMGGGY